jgi:hypothetical protein
MGAFVQKPPCQSTNDYVLVCFVFCGIVYIVCLCCYFFAFFLCDSFISVPCYYVLNLTCYLR